MPQPLGAITRGTTGHNRLRRSDRWLVHEPRVRHVLQTAADPLVVDLGYGALPVTTLELARALGAVATAAREEEQVTAARGNGEEEHTARRESQAIDVKGQRGVYARRQLPRRLELRLEIRLDGTAGG